MFVRRIGLSRIQSENSCQVFMGINIEMFLATPYAGLCQTAFGIHFLSWRDNKNDRVYIGQMYLRLFAPVSIKESNGPAGRVTVALTRRLVIIYSGTALD